MHKKLIIYLMLMLPSIILWGCKSTNVDKLRGADSPLSTSSNENILKDQNSNLRVNKNREDTNNEIFDSNEQSKIKSNQESLNCLERQVQINYKNFRFNCNPLLSSQITISEFKESPLLSDQDKPDYVHPAYISMRFSDGLLDKKGGSSYVADINFYPIDEFRKMFSGVESESKEFTESIESLKKVLLTQPSFMKDSIPILKFNDGYQAVKAHIKYHSFKNGRGISFITHLSTEANIISNKELIWIFQGITNDNKYYIYAVFPISTPLLPDEPNKDLTQNYSIPIDFWDKNKHEQYQKEFDKYLLKIDERLNKTRAEEYKPNIGLLDNLVNSIEVDQ